MQTIFFYLERFLKKLADNQSSSITKGSINHINHMYIHPFTTVVVWPEIGCLMEVSIMFYACRYCVFYLVRQKWWNDSLTCCHVAIYFHVFRFLFVCLFCVAVVVNDVVSLFTAQVSKCQRFLLKYMPIRKKRHFLACCPRRDKVYIVTSLSAKPS